MLINTRDDINRDNDEIKFFNDLNSNIQQLSNLFTSNTDEEPAINSNPSLILNSDSEKKKFFVSKLFISELKKVLYSFGYGEEDLEEFILGRFDEKVLKTKRKVLESNSNVGLIVDGISVNIILSSPIILKLFLLITDMCIGVVCCRIGFRFYIPMILL
jgi:hypothetical protein